MKNYVWVIKEIAGWRNDPDQEDLLTEAFADVNDAMQYCQKLYRDYVDDFARFEIEEYGQAETEHYGIWEGEMLVCWQKRDTHKEHGDIERRSWQCIRMNLHY